MLWTRHRRIQDEVRADLLNKMRCRSVVGEGRRSWFH